VLDAAYDAGLPGPSRLHDLVVNFEGITPSQYKEMGDGLDIRYGIHPGFLGDFIVAATDRGICGLQFVGEHGPEAALADIRRRLPGATFR
jgi:AraC family transcriptional regulator of adaptative response/methylated-DNA-[protein]-cysteine methyltransferase